MEKVAEWLNVRLNVNKSYISRIINGGMRPSPQRARELKEISGVSVEDWLLLDEEKLRARILIAYHTNTITND